MPARSLVLDDIGQKLKWAMISEVVHPVCCFKDEAGHECKNAAAALLVLHFKDGRVDVFALCEKDLLVVRDRHAIEREDKQAMFFY
ncbi:MAG TPA: hypothetical protein VN915_06820 [Elusimicrobiota bacterium]|nr:hypothetical protein [Elusimicrobiota bacterium]